MQCSAGPDPALASLERRAERRIRQLCARYGIEPVIGGDPRGPTVRLRVPSGLTNDFFGAGILVPDAEADQ